MWAQDVHRMLIHEARLPHEHLQFIYSIRYSYAWECIKNSAFKLLTVDMVYRSLTGVVPPRLHPKLLQPSPQLTLKADIQDNADFENTAGESASENLRL